MKHASWQVTSKLNSCPNRNIFHVVRSCCRIQWFNQLLGYCLFNKPWHTSRRTLHQAKSLSKWILFICFFSSLFICKDFNCFHLWKIFCFCSLHKVLGASKSWLQKIRKKILQKFLFFWRTAKILFCFLLVSFRTHVSPCPTPKGTKSWNYTLLLANYQKWLLFYPA